MSATKTFVITGANRGIGRGLFDKLYAKHTTSNFIITVRNEQTAVAAGFDKLDRVKYVHMDLEKYDTIAAAVKKIEELAPDGIDELWNNAGFIDRKGHLFDTEVDPNVLMREMSINIVAPIYFTSLIMPLLDKKDTRRIFFLGSRIGCYNFLSKRKDFIRDMRLDNGYSVSKAGINYAIMAMAAIHQPRGYTIAGFHPGYVATDMTSDSNPAFDSYKISVDTSVNGLIATSEKLTSADEYAFLSYDGTNLDTE